MSSTAVVDKPVETSTEEEVPKWRVERDTHGQESIAQKIGNLTRQAEVVNPDGDKFPYVRASLAYNRGENQESAFLTLYIYGVKESADADDSTRPSTEELQTLASKLKGRVKVQGKHDVKPSRHLVDGLKAELGLDADDRSNDYVNALFFGGQESMTLFIRQNQLDIENTFDDGTERRPITLLPPIGDGTSKEDPKSIF